MSTPHEMAAPAFRLLANLLLYYHIQIPAAAKLLAAFGLVPARVPVHGLAVAAAVPFAAAARAGSQPQLRLVQALNKAASVGSESALSGQRSALNGHTHVHYGPKNVQQPLR